MSMHEIRMDDAPVTCRGAYDGAVSVWIGDLGWPPSGPVTRLWSRDPDAMDRLAEQATAAADALRRWRAGEGVEPVMEHGRLGT